MPTSKRRRRTPEEAKAEILDAAQVILLRDGPTELKFQTLAKEAGLAVSNVYHHFGGVLEIKQALAARVLSEINTDLASALVEKHFNTGYDLPILHKKDCSKRLIFLNIQERCS